MPDQINEQGVVDEATEDYIDTINKLKQNTVDRSKYETLKAENKRLLDSIVNGQEIEISKSEPKKSIEELRKDWLNENNNNLQSIEACLKLREALISEGNPDPFLPIGQQIFPTDEDVEKANNVAQVLQECVDYAEGDSNVFTNELQRRLVDVNVTRGKFTK